MNNPLFFSGLIALLLRRIQFWRITGGRFAALLFKKNKEIVCLQLEQEGPHLFDKGLVIVRYRFANALYYRFSGIKTTTEAGPLVLQADKLQGKSLELTVYGYFRKQTYRIAIRPAAYHFRSDTFRTSLKSIRQVEAVPRSARLIAANAFSGLSVRLLVRPAVMPRGLHIAIKPSLIKTNTFYES